MPDLSMKVRKVERATGCSIKVDKNEAGRILRLEATDAELGVTFIRGVQSPSRVLPELHGLHEDIYHARAKEKYRLQGGKCSRCGRNLNGSGECNHIVHRSKGRDDRLSNLEIVCPALSNGCDFHQREHGLTGQRRSA